MSVKSFKELCATLHGKRLPSAVYLYRPLKAEVVDELWNTMKRAETAANPDPNWNILKLHTDEFAVTFLTYPDFDSDPHPALADATKINLNSGKVVTISYRKRANPPILHRKETFLPPGDRRFDEFAALTKSEEAAGLYKESAKIGLRIQWQMLLAKMGVTLNGHQLLRISANRTDPRKPAFEVEIARHRTAIRRYDLSKPIKLLMERGLLNKTDKLFDYGCGHGMDVEGLTMLGYQASGWDPAFCPNAVKTKADVVNLGYVLNVIERPEERASALREAYSLTVKILAVATLVTGKESEAHSKPYLDGFLTKTNTFQKFYAPGELEKLIEEVLGVEVVTVSLGFCLVFRREQDAEQFQVSRSRRKLDWSTIDQQLAFAQPLSRERRSVDRYELNKELFDQFAHSILELGRPPERAEFDRLKEVSMAAGGLKRALAIVSDKIGETAIRTAANARSEDVLIYLAMMRFRKRLLKREIPIRTKWDIRSFFGETAIALKRADELLFAAGDPGEIELACENVKLGVQDEDSLTIHRSLLDALPGVLRIFVYCAAFRYGDPSQADLIKIHKHSGKITFQHYDDFDGAPYPELKTRIKINLRNLFVEVFDYSSESKAQLLLFKERFVDEKYPDRAKWIEASKRLRALGFDEKTIGYGPHKEEFFKTLAAANLNLDLSPKE